MSEIKDGRPVVYAPDRSVWRQWLAENGNTEEGAWLVIYHKKSKVPSINLNDAVEEALCYGWIDSKANGKDYESFYLTFTPRNPKKSNWSKTNIERAERLIKNGQMTQQGMKMIEIAMEQGAWPMK